MTLSERVGQASLPVFWVADSRHFGTVCEGRRFLNLGANHAKRVTLWLLGAIKGDLLAAAIDEYPSTVSRFVL